MSKEICYLVKDLLPLYIDDLCSEDSTKIIKNHLENCSECNKEYERLANQPEIKVVNDNSTELIKGVSKRFKEDKKKAIIKTVVFSFTFVIIIALIFSIGMFCSGSSVFSDMYKNQPETQSKILEVQYKITKKDKVLKSLCSSLQMVSNENQNNEHLEKFVLYSGIYLKDNDNVSYCSLYCQYLMALSKLSEYEKLKIESKNFLDKYTSESDFKILYVALYGIKEEGSQQDKDYVKNFATEILDGSYLNANSEEYTELQAMYLELTE